MSDQETWTATHRAAFAGDVPTLEALGPADVNAPSALGNTPLYLAACEGKVGAVRWLLEHGAKPDVQCEKGFTPLYAAAQADLSEVAEALLTQANVNFNTLDGTSALYVAAQEGCDRVAEVLLKHGADTEYRPPTFGATPLMIACMHGRLRVCDVLIRHGAQINVGTSRSGRTPLHSAAVKDHQICKMLVDNKAFVNAAMNNGETPMHLVAATNFFNIARLLKQSGGDPTKKRNDGKTPLDLATTQAMRDALNDAPQASAYSANTTGGNNYSANTGSGLRPNAPTTAPVVTISQITDAYKDVLELFKKAGFEESRALVLTFNCQKNGFASDVLPDLVVLRLEDVKNMIGLTEIADTIRFQQRFLPLLQQQKPPEKGAAIRQPPAAAPKPPKVRVFGLRKSPSASPVGEEDL